MAGAALLSSCEEPNTKLKLHNCLKLDKEIKPWFKQSVFTKKRKFKTNQIDSRLLKNNFILCYSSDGVAGAKLTWFKNVIQFSQEKMNNVLCLWKSTVEETDQINQILN